MSDIRENAPAPVRRPSRLLALKLFGIAALAPFAITLCGSLIPDMGPNAEGLLSNVLYYLPFLVLPVLLCVRRGKMDAESLRPNPLPVSSMFSIVAAALICVFLVNDIILLWAIPFQKMGFNLDAFSMHVPTDPMGLSLCILYAAVLPGVCEELLFRGAMLPAFEQYGTRRARVITALLFALLHGNIIGLPTQIMLGLILADVVILTDSIYGGMVFHTVYNAALLIIQSIQTGTAAAEPVGDYFALIGGMGGVLTMLVSIAISGLLVHFTLRILRLRARLEGRVPIPGTKRRLSGSEIGVLAAGLTLVLVRYVLVCRTMLTS